MRMFRVFHPMYYCRNNSISWIEKKSHDKNLTPRKKERGK